tara:strand:+ start:49 stop:204 length:156 start_codon:yes stop_codon:yes gene_type:complete
MISGIILCFISMILIVKRVGAIMQKIKNFIDIPSLRNPTSSKRAVIDSFIG